jgi:hypothetical protein
MDSPCYFSVDGVKLDISHNYKLRTNDFTGYEHVFIKFTVTCLVRLNIQFRDIGGTEINVT